MAKYTDERASDADMQKTVELSGVQARQGFLGRPVLMVLICGVVLAMLAWAGAEVFGESTDNDAATKVEEKLPAPNNGAPATQETPVDPAQMAPADKDPTPQTGSGG
ncbi:hypothetical protein ASE23_06450 [Rhizobium sp. Root73]|uniref:hypothetical protein n=1 Tax=unclassified Rhizobium TaxID=2613769 RepID=UPI000713E5E8|nr:MULTISPECIES: hypothetical protein [unclassified Rhizobium]KQV31467.1 hypothetical protein ASC96_08770 [Rhizobium sp. Root1204]KQY11149.1 hypothetical protein ASD36_08680 [Rhizobium sp. Root1334]KRC05143.1 hypothetical protein ASE23_06450 [Rhizobium sp. Root73]